MKKYTISSFILCLLTITGCKDDDGKEEMIVLPGWGEFSATLNGEPWEALPDLAPNSKNSSLYHFDIRKYSTDGFLRSQLDVNALSASQIASKQKILLQRTNYQMFFDTTNASFHTFKSHGDVVTGSYAIIENDTIEDYIQFIEIDSTTKEVSGIFQGSFAIPEESNPSYSGYGDTIILRNGVFHTKIQ